MPFKLAYTRSRCPLVLMRLGPAQGWFRFHVLLVYLLFQYSYINSHGHFSWHEYMKYVIVPPQSSIMPLKTRTVQELSTRVTFIGIW